MQQHMLRLLMGNIHDSLSVVSYYNAQVHLIVVMRQDTVSCRTQFTTDRLLTFNDIP